jgi:hypothetical protein
VPSTRAKIWQNRKAFKLGIRQNLKMKKLLFDISIVLFSTFILSLFVYPVAGKHYGGFVNGWLVSSMHGSCLVVNYIHSLFDPEKIIKATSYSWAYIFWWWISAIGSIFTIFINPIVGYLKTKK